MGVKSLRKPTEWEGATVVFHHKGQVRRGRVLSTRRFLFGWRALISMEPFGTFLPGGLVYHNLLKVMEVMTEEPPIPVHDEFVYGGPGWGFQKTSPPWEAGSDVLIAPTGLASKALRERFEAAYAPPPTFRATYSVVSESGEFPITRGIISGGQGMHWSCRTSETGVFHHFLETTEDPMSLDMRIIDDDDGEKPTGPADAVNDRLPYPDDGGLKEQVRPVEETQSVNDVLKPGRLKLTPCDEDLKPQEQWETLFEALGMGKYDSLPGKIGARLAERHTRDDAYQRVRLVRTDLEGDSYDLKVEGLRVQPPAPQEIVLKVDMSDAVAEYRNLLAAVVEIEEMADYLRHPALLGELWLFTQLDGAEHRTFAQLERAFMGLPRASLHKIVAAMAEDGFVREQDGEIALTALGLVLYRVATASPTGCPRGTSIETLAFRCAMSPAQAQKNLSRLLAKGLVTQEGALFCLTEPQDQ